MAVQKEFYRLYYVKDSTNRYKTIDSENSMSKYFQNIKSQLTTSIGLEEVIVRSALTKDEIKKIIATPPG